VDKQASLSIWQVSAEGGNLHRLLTGWRESPPFFSDGESGGDWTQDGNYFVFRSQRAGLTSLWAIREQGGLLSWLSRSPVLLTTAESHIWSATSGQNGRRIFFTGSKEKRELARYDAGLGKFVPYFSGIRAFNASASRDGRWIAYDTPDGQESVIWRSRIDGTDRLQLTFPPMIAGAPRWSPDGKHIAFAASYPGKPLNIFLISPDGGTPEALTNECYLYPDWSPQGDSLFFSQCAPAVGVYQLDLKTRRQTLFPGSEGLKASGWSPDGRYLTAQSRDDRRLMLFGSQSRKWSELAQGTLLRSGSGLWSRDSHYVYWQDSGEGAEQPIYRARISDRKIERVAGAAEIPRADVLSYGLTGMAPDGSPSVSLYLGNSDIYALDVDFR
jgi:Tol biopolymer transport system component